MNELFRTANQSGMFLAVLPLGFLLALCLDLHAAFGRFRPVMDVLCLLMGGAGVVLLMLLKRDDDLRLYHLLAVLAGAALYRLGVGRAARLLLTHIRKKKNTAIQQDK